MSLQEILKLIPCARKVTGDYNLGTGAVYRRIFVKKVFDNVANPPQPGRIPLRYKNRIFELCRDGLTQACLKVLFERYHTTETFAEVSTPPYPDIKTGVYTCVQHVVWAIWNTSVIELVCRTYWFPVGLRFQETVTLEEYNICINPLRDTDTIMRRKMIRTAQFIARDIINMRTVQGPIPPFLFNIERDIVMCAKLIQRQRIQVNPNGRSRIVIECNDPYSTTIESWPIRLGADLDVDDEDALETADSEQRFW